MRKILFLILGLSLSQSVVSQDTLVRKNSAGENEKWVMSFGDDFEGTKLDESKWRIIEGIPRDPMQGSNYVWYLRENVEVSQGLLKLVLKNDTMIDRPYDIWIKDGMKCYSF
jgi:hypothetical protein